MTVDSVRSLPHKRAFSLAWPMILSNLTVPLVGLVDTALLGHFSSPLHMGAVAVGASLISAVVWIFGFVRMGTTSLVGRARGAAQHDRAIDYLKRSLLLAGGIAAAIMVLQAFFVSIAMAILTPEGAIREAASQYALIRINALPAILGTAVIVGFFIGSQDTKRPLFIAIFVNLLNIFFGLLFVGVFKWESAGAAWAAVLAEYSGLVLAAVLLWRRLSPELRVAFKRWRRVGLRSGWRQMLVMNSDLFVRTLILYASLGAISALGSRMGEETLAANGILLQLTMVAAYGLDGYAHAAEAMSARAVGARDKRDFYRSVAAASFPAAAIAVVMTSAVWFLGDPLLRAMTSHESVISIAHDYLHWAAIVPILSCAAYLFDGVFIGAGKTRSMRNTMILSTLLVFFGVLAYSWLVYGEVTNTALWVAFCAQNLARGVSLGLVFRRITRQDGWIPPVS